MAPPYKEGVCRQIPVNLQGVTRLEDALPLSLKSVDLILGMQWLMDIGWVHAHFRGFIFQFKHEGKIHTMRGDPNLQKTIIDPLQAEKELLCANAFMAELYMVDIADNEGSDPSELWKIIELEFPQ